VNALKQSIFGMIFLLFGGCSLGPAQCHGPERPPPESLSKIVAVESHEVGERLKELVGAMEKTSEQIAVEPVIPTYDPLEDHMVSFSMIDEDPQLVLYSLARSVGMNLIMDPSLREEKRLITLNFEKVSAATVLREILKSYDLYYEIDRNVIRVKPYQERFFSLNFLDTNVDMSFDVGGDVLGAGNTGSGEGLSGNFKLSGKGAKKGNAYDLVEQMMQGMISKGGKYSLNRLSGSLYIKDTPAVVYAAARLVNHLREMLSRQILIEARIIEVSLYDRYSYGIDWSLLREEIDNAKAVKSASWSLGEGLVMTGEVGTFSMEAMTDALRTFGDTNIVSNPSIRSKHGIPAIISVGTSFTYKKSVTTTSTTTATEGKETTDVEVSTVFDGLILGIIPFIEEDGSITLLINPIKSDVEPTSIEPVPVNSRSADSISLPEVSIKEISTTIGLNSGDVIYLGGLIDKSHQIEKKGVPFLSTIPVIGYLFWNEYMLEKTREMVIVLSVSMA
jgi:MSHA type pilus biogenesis protein MshL